MNSMLGFEYSALDRPPVGRLVSRTLLVNQVIALPIALAMTSVGGPFWRMLAVATIYSQIIGLTCSTVAWATFPVARSLDDRRRRVLVTIQYFLCGAAGAEIARRVTPLIAGAPFYTGPPHVSWAIGAVVALIVGVVLMIVQHLRARVIATEFEALQARINPHFLFNTLNSIAALIREDPARAETMTLHLSELFRYTLQAPRQGLVTLEEEMTIVEGYLAIEQERLGPRLRYRMDVDHALLGAKVPALVVQPLVENAIKHGIACSVSGGDILVRLVRDGEAVNIDVVNSGIADGSPGGLGEGLDNVRRRLHATLGPQSSVMLHREARHTIARIRIPSNP